MVMQIKFVVVVGGGGGGGGGCACLLGDFGDFNQ